MVNRPTAVRVKSLAELLQSDQTTSPLISSAGNKITMLALSKLRPFKTHPFHLYKDERLEDLVQSIQSNGILTPMIIRKNETDAEGREYEILAGHNRWNGAKLAGLTEGPCIIKYGLSDKEAWMYVIETNVIQRSFKDMLPSEKATVIALSYSKMFSPGKRSDIMQELRRLEQPGSIKAKVE